MAEVINSTVFEASGGSIAVDSQTKTTTTKYVGSYDAVEDKAALFEVGTDNVKAISLVKTDGATGELTITKTESALSDTTTGEPEANWELTMTEIELPLAAHPKFPATHLSKWALFLASPVEVQLSNQYAVRPTDPNSPCETITDISDWCDLYNSGIQTYKAYLPVIVKTQVYHGSAPTPTNIGKIDKPTDTPSEDWTALASSWLKVGDNISYDGRERSWTRSQQWAGNGEWPTLLYTDSLNKSKT